jgi:hypothetical protein
MSTRKRRALILFLSFSLFAALAMAAPDKYIEVAPCRLVDTRSGPQPGLLAAGSARAILVTGAVAGSSCNIPSNAKAVSVNLTAVGPTVQGFLTLYPSSSAFPGVSSLNVLAGTPAIANSALVPLNFDGTAAVEPSIKVVYGTNGGGTTHFVLDVTGYFVDGTVSAFATFGGDGSSGTPDFSGGGTLPSGAQYLSLNIPSGQLVTVSGGASSYVAVRGTCALAGTLVVPPRPGVFTNSGDNGTADYTGQLLDPAPTVRFCLGGFGGPGGSDSPSLGPLYGGGAGHSITTGESLSGQTAWGDLILPLWTSCGGGGGGAGFTSGSCGGAPGEGGGGGAVLYLECGALDFPASGLIHADGGQGGDGTGGCGAGGGGGGGVVIIRTRRVISNAGTITVKGGAKGSGGSVAAYAGQDGVGGKILVVQ